MNGKPSDRMFNSLRANSLCGQVPEMLKANAKKPIPKKEANVIAAHMRYKHYKMAGQVDMSGHGPRAWVPRIWDRDEKIPKGAPEPPDAVRDPFDDIRTFMDPVAGSGFHYLCNMSDTAWSIVFHKEAPLYSCKPEDYENMRSALRWVFGNPATFCHLALICPNFLLAPGKS